MNRAVGAGVLAFVAACGVFCFKEFLHRRGDVPEAMRPWLDAGALGAIALLAATVVGLALAWERATWRAQSWIAAGLFALMALAPAAAKTAGRLALGPHRMTLDSILQVEAAAEKLAAGENPYATSLHGTDLERWHASPDTYALRAYPYPPLTMLLTVPPREACLRLFGRYDSRFALIPAMVAAFAICWFRWRDVPWRGALLAAAFLNPLLLPNLHVGRWDTLVLLFWVLAMARPARGSAVWLALAALTKPTFLAAAAFGMVYASARGRWLAAFLAPCVLVTAPFLIWDAPAFLTDVVGGAFGAGGQSWPILDAGLFGLGGIPLYAGWVPSEVSPFPFWVVQVPVTAVVAWVGLRRLQARRTLTAFAVGTALTIAAFHYFGRVSDPAYFGTLLSMAVVGAGFEAARHAQQESASPSLLRQQAA